MEKRIYLDYASSTPLDPQVLSAMQPYFYKLFGNPGSTHREGQIAFAALAEAREMISLALGAEWKNTLFLPSATEANNFILRGALSVWGKSHPGIIPEYIISPLEHPSLIATAKDLAREGKIILHFLKVTEAGIVDFTSLSPLLSPRTCLIAVQSANSELGTLQPIQEIAALISSYKESKKNNSHSGLSTPRSKRDPESIKNNSYPLFHIDAVQSFQYFPITLAESGADSIIISSHKLYGPKGAAALSLKNSSLSSPLLFGDTRESGLRSGTENVPSIVGFGKAVELAEKNRAKESKRIKILRDFLWEGLAKIYPHIKLNGDLERRLPHNLSVYFPGTPSTDFMIELDMQGIAVSAGTACSARALTPSPVLEILYPDSDRPYSSLRFTLGRPTKKSDLVSVLKILKNRRPK